MPINPTPFRRGTGALALASAMLLAHPVLAGQDAPKPPPGMTFPAPTPNDTLFSPVVEGKRVTLSIYAPDAKAVQLAGEMTWPNKPVMTRAANGVWSIDLPDVKPGTYRYSFVVDGLTISDPRNPNVSPTNNTVGSLVHVDGIAVEDAAPVPHGAMSSVVYAAPGSARMRRMHVYTPPGYSGQDSKRYPVLYLLHGGGDSDASWPTIGRAGFILDNLIASGRAVPMIVVMPAGHMFDDDGRPVSGRAAMGADPAKDPFTRDFLTGIMPTIERSYRVAPGAQNRAIAGLSMGGIQTANIGLTNSDKFRQVAVFSSGWFPDDLKAFEQTQQPAIAQARRNLGLLWIGWGKDDDLVQANAKGTVEMLRRNGLKPEVHLTEGAHYWGTWRTYLAMLAPRLFK